MTDLADLATAIGTARGRKAAPVRLVLNVLGLVLAGFRVAVGSVFAALVRWVALCGWWLAPAPVTTAPARSP